MTFKEFMGENGYQVKSTFWEDFSIADRYGEKAIRDTYKRAFEGWSKNVVYLTELCMVLNHKIWQHSEHNEKIAKVYNELWEKCDRWCCENLDGEDLEYYYTTTD